MSNNKKFYLYVGNHISLIGVWEQVKITLRTFHELGIEIDVSTIIIPNHINIIIEEFNEKFNIKLLEVKKNYPETKFILYVSEYISKNGSLNIFNLKQKILRIIFKSFPNYFYRHYYDSGRLAERLMNYIHGFFALFFRKIKFFNYHHERMMARREKFLLKFKNKNLFSFAISTTERVLQNYDTLFDLETYYVPVFVNKNNLSKRAAEGYKRSIVFSGNLTNYRKKILDNFSQELNNGTPLFTTFIRSKDSREFKDYSRKTKELADLGYTTKYLADSSFFQFLPTLYDCDKKEFGLFEIYIPQSNNWNLSSPNRTLFSLEEGFIPIDYGEFNDHNINQLPFKVSGLEDILNLVLFENLDNIIKSILNKIDSYNAEEMKHLPPLKNKLESLR